MRIKPSSSPIGEASHTPSKPNSIGMMIMLAVTNTAFLMKEMADATLPLLIAAKNLAENTETGSIYNETRNLLEALGTLEHYVAGIDGLSEIRISY